MEGCGMVVVWSWIPWSAAAPLGCAVLHREPRSAPVSLGLRPHSHLGHREKECADLMMYRKSDEPHSVPSAAIGQHSASESPAHSELRPPYKRHEETWYAGPLTIKFAWGHALRCYALSCSTSPVTSTEVEEVSARQDREQEG